MPTRVSKFANVLIFAVDKVTSHSCIILYKDMRLQGDHTALHQHGSLQQETARSTNKQKVYHHFSLAHPGCITQHLQARCGAQTLAKNTLSGKSQSLCQMINQWPYDKRISLFSAVSVPNTFL